MFGYEYKLFLGWDSALQGYRLEDEGKRAWREEETWLWKLERKCATLETGVLGDKFLAPEK